MKIGILIGVVVGIALGSLFSAIIYNEPYLPSKNEHYLPAKNQPYLPPECRGDIPKSVPFYQGMTLCPGQGATFTIERKELK